MMKKTLLKEQLILFKHPIFQTFKFHFYKKKEEKKKKKKRIKNISLFTKERKGINK